MNVWNGIGRMVFDPEVKQSAGENPTSVCRFRIAVDSGYGKNAKTAWLTIVAFGATADNIGKYCHKGKEVGVTGRIETGSYEKKDGTKVNTFEIIATEVKFMSGNSGASKRTAPAEEQQSMMPDDIADGFAALDSDSVPF